MKVNKNLTVAATAYFMIATDNGLCLESQVLIVYGMSDWLASVPDVLLLLLHLQLPSWTPFQPQSPSVATRCTFSLKVVPVIRVGSAVPMDHRGASQSGCLIPLCTNGAVWFANPCWSQHVSGQSHVSSACLSGKSPVPHLHSSLLAGVYSSSTVVITAPAASRDQSQFFSPTS